MSLDPHRIPPGLASIPYRVGTWASFLAAMSASMTSGRWPALRELRTRETDDPAMALCDAWATVADVLTFYQERIANEGYLGTARRRASIIQLGRLTGYALRPGLASEVFLAYTLAPGAPAVIDPGHRVQTVPPPGNLPQTFESVDTLEAHADWNRLALRMTRPQVVTLQGDDLYLAGISSQLKKNAPLVVAAGAHAVLRRVAQVSADPVANRTRVTLQSSRPGPAAVAAAVSRAQTDADATALDHEVAATPLRRMVELVDPLTLPPAMHPRSAAALARSPATTFLSNADTTPALLTRLQPRLVNTLYPALSQVDVAPPIVATVHALRVQAAPFGHSAPRQQVLGSKGVVVGSAEWAIGDSARILVELDASAPEQSTSGAELRIGSLFVRRKARPADLGITIDVGGVHASTALALPTSDRTLHLGPWKVDIRPKLDAEVPTIEFRFGPAPLSRAILLSILDRGEAISVGFDDKDERVTVAHGESTQRSDEGSDIEVAFGDAVRIVDERALAADPKVLTLDALHDEILPGSWVIVERPRLTADPDQARAAMARLVTRVDASRRTTVSRYNQNGRVTELTLHDPWLDSKRDLSLGDIRDAVVSAQSDELALSEEPITEPAAGDTLELEGLYPGLESGRWLIVQGERSDIPGTSGVQAAERVMLKSLLQDVRAARGERLLGETTATPLSTAAGVARPGDSTHSFLRLASPLGYQYRRETVKVFGNVTRATYGETRFEILGHGDASQVGQTFMLHIPPLTHVPAPTPSGHLSTLTLLVNDQPWREVASFATAGPRDRVYITRTDDSGLTTVGFGDGVRGARLPTGMANVKAQYRSGVGVGGNVDAGLISLQMTRPAGVKDIINPMPAVGGADVESRDEARANLPTGLSNLNRLVSLGDYARRALTFAGVSKATAVRLGQGGQATIALTIAANGGDELPPDVSLLVNLERALQQAAGARQRLVLLQREQRLLVAAVRIGAAAGVLWDDLAGRVRSSLLERFSFDARALGQAVTRAEFEAAVRGIDGVANVVVTMLDSVAVADAATPASLAAKLAAIAGGARPAETVPALQARIGAKGGFLPAQLLLLHAAISDTLILVQG